MVLTIVRCTLNVNEPKSNRILVSEYNTFAFRTLLYTEPDYCKTFKLFEALKFQEKCLWVKIPPCTHTILKCQHFEFRPTENNGWIMPFCTRSPNRILFSREPYENLGMAIWFSFKWISMGCLMPSISKCCMIWGMLIFVGTTLQSVMNAKLSKHRFWHCHEDRLIKTIQTIPHNL